MTTNALIRLDTRNDHSNGDVWPVEDTVQVAAPAAAALRQAHNRAARDPGYDAGPVFDACGARKQSFAKDDLMAQQIQLAFMGPLTTSNATVVRDG